MSRKTPVFINLLAIARYDHMPDYPIQFIVFAKGQRFEGVYHTPYGEMDMAVYTREATCKFGRKEGNIHLKYQLNVQGSYASTNELHLEYRAEQRGEDQKGKQ